MAKFEILSKLSAEVIKDTALRRTIAFNQLKDRLFKTLAFALFVCSMLFLLILLGDLFRDGVGRLSLEFMSNFPSRFASRAGILSAWVGSLLVVSVVLFIAVMIGVAAGIYLEEYAPRSWLTTFIEINIANLAAVPSILFGLMALGLFVYKLGFGQSILTAGLTLSLLILPIIIVATREALKSVPKTIREAAYGMGATKWRMIKDHLLPYSMGGILTGVIIALSRAIGETAPLITIGALTFIAFLPNAPIQTSPPFVNFDWLWSPFSVLPIQMFNWISRPQEEFHTNAAATGVVLVLMTFSLNLVAILLRSYYRRKIKW